MKDHHDLYLKCDVLIIADVFEELRNISLKNYGLCPRDYLGAPGLSQHAILKMTKTELVGISYISNRYSKANNKYLMVQTKNQNILSIQARIVYMAMQCILFF